MTPAAQIPWRVAIVQRTFPRYRIPTYETLIGASAPGSVLLHGKVHSAKQPKQNAFLGPVSFKREALRCWTIALRIREQLIYPVFLPTLGAALRRARPDVIVTEGESNLLNNFAVARYARRNGIPYIWWGLGAIPGGRPSGLRRLFGGLLKRMIQRAGGVACYSSYAREFYIGEGADPRTCIVVPNVLDHRAAEEGIARFAADAADERRARGVGDNDLVLLTVGSLEAPKRIHLALEAMAPLRAQMGRRKIHYWVVGDGPERAALEAHAERLGLQDVRFWGSEFDAVSRYFLMADIFVLPGLGGLSLNQAMMHGLPVVCGPADGTERDLLDGGHAGTLLPHVTVPGLADAIASLADDETRTAMGHAAQVRVREYFSLDAQKAAFAELITAVMTDDATHPGLTGGSAN